MSSCFWTGTIIAGLSQLHLYSFESANSFFVFTLHMLNSHKIKSILFVYPNNYEGGDEEVQIIGFPLSFHDDGNYYPAASFWDLPICTSSSSFCNLVYLYPISTSTLHSTKYSSFEVFICIKGERATCSFRYILFINAFQNAVIQIYDFLLLNS